MIHFGFSPEQERQDARSLWEQMFPEDSVSFLNYYDAVKVPENGIVIRRVDGRPAAMVQWNPVTLSVRGRSVRSAYLVGVATVPGMRHRGLMAGLLEEGLRDLAEAGIPFVFLMPADPRIYTPFGFRYIYDRTVFHGKCLFPGEHPSFGEDLEIRRVDPDDYAAAAGWAGEQLARKFEVFQARDAGYLETASRECVSEDGGLYGIFRGGRTAGLFSWWEDGGISLRDLILAPDFESENGTPSPEITGALGRYFAGRNGWRAVTCGGTGDHEPIIMARAADAAAFLEMFRSGEEAECTVQIDDPLVPANNGCYLWNVGPDGSRAVRTNRDPDIKLNIAELAQRMLAGRNTGTFRGTAGDPDREKAGAGIRLPRPDGSSVTVRPMRGVFLPEIV